MIVSKDYQIAMFHIYESARALEHVSPLLSKHILDNHQIIKMEGESFREIIAEAAREIEYLQEKFKATGSGNAVLARLEDALSE